MSKKSKQCFEQPKRLLIFDQLKKLIFVSSSLSNVSNVKFSNIQSISAACTGRTISSGGWYFRYANPNVEIEVSKDVGILDVEEYDDLCNENRRYHTSSEMARRRKFADGHTRCEYCNALIKKSNDNE